MTDKAPELNPPPQPNGTLFECKLDHSNCDHEWLPENGNPEYCGKCGTSLMAYAFMECP